MAEPASKSRLRPSLLDRLTDLHPERQRETADEVVVTEARLREQVRRDLTWLFNATHLEAGSSLDLTPYPHVQASVLNFGLVDLTGHTLSSIRPDRLEHSVRRALVNYEPRLVPDTISVAVELGKNPFGAAAVVVEIRAELFAEPLPLSLHVRTEIDIETGRVRVGDAHGVKGG